MPHDNFPKRARAFTLVEILIVVVILGILAAIVTPRFAEATSQAQEVATADQLTKLRRMLAMYYARSNSQYPSITAGVGTWGELLTQGYMRQPPVNGWVGGVPGQTIIFGSSADTGYQSTHGWIFDVATGNVWAGGFDSADEPFPR